MASYRCGHEGCRKRYTFAKPLENYRRLPRGVTEGGLCGLCGVGLLHETNHHIRRWNKRFPVCNCGAIPFPHREGSTSYYAGARRVCAMAGDHVHEAAAEEAWR